MAQTAVLNHPEKVPLTFDIRLESLPSSHRKAVEEFKKVSEAELYSWDSFSYSLPDTLLDKEGSKNLQLQNLLKVPNFDETNELSRDSSGNIVRLNDDQLVQVRKFGQFDVKSAHFPGEKHRWRLNRLINKGTENTLQSFYKDISRALFFIVIAAKGRLLGTSFSVLRAFKGFLDAFHLFADMLIGLPYTNPGDVDHKLLEERLRFHVCELGVKASHKKYLEEFWDYFEQLVYLPPEARKNLIELNQQNPNEGRRPPYQFVTPSRLPVDLRLHNEPLMQRCLPIVSDIMRNARTGWFQEFKDILVSRLRREGKNYEEIKEIVRKTSLKEFSNRLFEAMRESESLAAIDPTIVEPLIRQARYFMLLQNSCNALVELWHSERDAHDQRLKANHPILWQIGAWRAKELRRLEEEFIGSHALSVHEFALEKCHEENLEQQAYFLQRDMAFFKERELLLRKELMKSTFPDSWFTFKTRLVFPKWWRVYRHHYDDEQVVETVILDARPEEDAQPSNLACGSAGQVASKNEPTNANDVIIDLYPQTYYTVQKNKVFSVSTKYPFWRWACFFLRTYTWLLSCLQFFLVKIPFRSRLSYTALFKASPVYPKVEFDTKTGYFYRSQCGKRHTFVSRLLKLWAHIRSSRAKFEANSNQSGFLDKNVTRHFHRFWVYVIQGFFGTLCLVVLMPVSCLIVSSLSIVVGVLVPLWLPLFSLAMHMIAPLFIDMYNPESRRNRAMPFFEIVIWHFLLRGISQALLALFIAFILSPTLAFFITLFALLRYTCRSLWDSIMFSVIIKRHARVPANDDFVARRISGPGIASNHFYQAKPVQILAVLESLLEQIELGLWEDQIKMLAELPKQTYENFMSTCMGPFSLGVVHKKNYARIVDSERKRLKDHKLKASERRNLLRVDSKFNEFYKIRLTSEDLHTVIKMGSKMTELFYNNRLKPRINQLKRSENEWWEQKDVRLNDFIGLCSHILGGIFGEQFFTCLEDADKVFKLEVNHLNLSRYVDMMDSAEFRDDLDSVNLQMGSPTVTIMTYMKVDLPMIEVTSFRPHSFNDMPTALSSKPIQKKRKFRLRPWVKRNRRLTSVGTKVDELVTELDCVYHPTIISLLLHRRDRENHVLDLTNHTVRDITQSLSGLSLIIRHHLDDLPITNRAEDAETATTATSLNGADDSETLSGANGQEPDLLRSVQPLADSDSSLNSVADSLPMHTDA